MPIASNAKLASRYHAPFVAKANKARLVFMKTFWLRQKPNQDYLIPYKLDFFCISGRPIFIVDCFYNADGVLVKANVTPGPAKAETVSVISRQNHS